MKHSKLCSLVVTFLLLYTGHAFALQNATHVKIFQIRSNSSDYININDLIDSESPDVLIIKSNNDRQFSEEPSYVFQLDENQLLSIYSKFNVHIIQNLHPHLCIQPDSQEINKPLLFPLQSKPLNLDAKNLADLQRDFFLSIFSILEENYESQYSYLVTEQDEKLFLIPIETYADQCPCDEYNSCDLLIFNNEMTSESIFLPNFSVYQMLATEYEGGWEFYTELDSEKGLTSYGELNISSSNNDEETPEKDKTWEYTLSGEVNVSPQGEVKGSAKAGVKGKF